MSAPITTTRDFSQLVGTSAVLVTPVVKSPVSFLRMWNVSTTATVWCSRAGTAAIGAAGSFPLAPGQSETFIYPQAIPSNPVSLIATAANTPVTIEVG